jgi:putative phosphoesterase
MVKYGIISDTHITSSTDSKSIDLLFSQLMHTFRDVDEIIHAGDICVKSSLIKLSEIAPTRAVAGECDLVKDLPKFLDLSAGKYKIGVIHEKPTYLKAFIQEKRIHILIFGHTHQPLIEGTPFNTLLINPGSPTNPKPPPEKRGFNKPIARPSVITMSIDENDILSTYIINLKL